MDIIDQVFGAANLEFEIPKLLDANDMDEPEELSVMTYISYFRQKDEVVHYHCVIYIENLLWSLVVT